jgi:drug/metabolite transporter (DMT)-like permease
MGDAIAKILAEDHAVMQIVLCRFAVQAAVLLPLVRATGRSFAMSPLGWQLTVARTVLHIAGLWMMITALTYLPLADAIAIAFVMPFILLLLGHLLLGETVGPRRLTACAVGFCGTLMVMQPSFAAVGWPALWPLGVAFSFAGFMLVTRRIAGEADPLAMQGMSGAIATAGLVLLYLLLPSEGLFALSPITGDWPFWLVMGLLGTGAHLLMTWSLRFAPASTLAPMQYLEIPIAAIIGLLVFGDWPNGLALAGIAVTIATGLYIVWRENADQRAAP